MEGCTSSHPRCHNKRMRLPLRPSCVAKGPGTRIKIAYHEDNDIFNFIRKLLALPFLPAEHISDMFDFLQTKAGSAKLRDLTAYIKDTWITGLWTSKHWSLFNQLFRTNNGVEGWHDRLNPLTAKLFNLNFHPLEVVSR